MERNPMSPEEFDRACRTLVRGCPWLSETSGYRSKGRNEAVGGSPHSKHLLGMARDFAAPSMNGLGQADKFARTLGLWTYIHDVGSGSHLHVQGLAPNSKEKGDVPDWWMKKYGGVRDGRTT